MSMRMVKDIIALRDWRNRAYAVGNDLMNLRFVVSNSDLPEDDAGYWLEQLERLRKLLVEVQDEVRA